MTVHRCDSNQSMALLVCITMLENFRTSILQRTGALGDSILRAIVNAPPSTSHHAQEVASRAGSPLEKYCFCLHKLFPPSRISAMIRSSRFSTTCILVST